MGGSSGSSMQNWLWGLLGVCCLGGVLAALLGKKKPKKKAAPKAKPAPKPEPEEPLVLAPLAQFDPIATTSTAVPSYNMAGGMPGGYPGGYPGAYPGMAI